MTLRDLQYRARRVALVTVLVALVLTLLYLMTGLVNQLQNEPRNAVDGIGADTWVVADGVSGPFTSVSVLPASLGASIGESAHPIVVSRGSLTTDGAEATEIVLVGHRPGELGQPHVVAGAGVAAADEVVVDRSLGLDVGDEVTVGPETFTVVGETADSTVLAGQALVFVDLASAQQLAFQSVDVVSGFVIDGSDPGDVDGATMLTGEQVADDALGPIESAVSSIDLIRILLWCVAAIVMGAVIYLTALERERDFAVLKAVGASGRSLGAGLAMQAVVVALIAAAIGAVAAKLIEPVFPLPVRIPGSALVIVPAVAVIVGLASAMIGVRKVNRTDPAEAFG
ncbi:ABC transporter permease [Ilumatobacter nonamiensis]|uniref:ABC transporter permease n=1 Tax=Ilumatobacter nonamiensis TaxID=467093 RepID=UPI001F4C897D|nr:FtsX-like permease family protein [Ilumatobacter nonamiensis]